MIPLSHSLILVIALFILGLVGVMVKRNLLFILIGLEIMMNAAALAFVIVGIYLKQEDGLIMYIIIITAAASEAAIALALLLQLYRRFYKLNIDNISEICK